jgi:hypothetical protein
MNGQRDFNVLNLRPDLGERLVDSGAYGSKGSGWQLSSCLKAAGGVLVAQVFIVAAGALFWSLVGAPLGF